MALIIPEIILLDGYKNILSFIRKDYKANIADPSKSFLGKMLDGTGAVERYNMFTQAKSVFITTEDNPRHLTVNLFFNAQKATIPTIHITNPSESAIHDALSISEGYNDYVFSDTDQTFDTLFNRRFRSRYNIVLTSDNTNEVVLMMHVLRSLSISMIEHLSLAGLENIKISVNDISLKTDIVPLNVFIKAIGIEFEYNVPAYKLKATDFTLGEFVPNGTPLSET